MNIADKLREGDQAFTIDSMWPTVGNPMPSLADQPLPKRKITMNFRKAGLALLPAVALAGSLSTMAQTPADGGNSADLRMIRAAAERGDAAAEVKLGTMYKTGQGVPLNYEQAFAWYRKAAEQGNVLGQLYLGKMYNSYVGVHIPLEDYETLAAFWFRKAADQGNADAQFSLGMMYLNGNGVPDDLAQAIIWIRKAADQGNAYAQYNLGWAYKLGIGVPKDETQATIWFHKAAVQGVTVSQ